MPPDGTPAMLTEGKGEHQEQQQIDVAELQAQLADAVRTRDDALEQLRTHHDATLQLDPPKAQCMFLDRLPLEMRNKIYTLLLVNEDLSLYSDLRDSGSFGRRFRCNIDYVGYVGYGLSPNIMRTNKQIYEEASVILYESNVFFIYFHHHGGFPMTPIIQDWRHDGVVLKKGKAAAMLCFPVLQKVKHWKVLIDVHSTLYFEYGPEHNPTKFFAYFCRLLCLNPSHSLQIAVRPAFADWENVGNKWNGSDFSYDEIKTLLEPLKLLRNIKRFQFTGTGGTKFLPYYKVCENKWSSVEPRKVSHAMENGIKQLVEGVSPAVLVFQMSAKLLSYARAFEQNEDLRRYMDPDDLTRKPKGWMYENVYNDGYTPGGRLLPDDDKKLLTNHPVEAGLSSSSIAAYQNNANDFKAQRNLVVQFLETQYKRIASAAICMVDFIKREKKHGGAFDITISSCSSLGIHSSLLAEAVVYLEDYAKAFNRDMPPSIRHVIRPVQSQLDAAYATLPSSILVRQVSNHLEALGITGHKGSLIDRVDLVDFFECYKLAVDALDEQYLRIRKARKALFDYDLDDPACEIDLESRRCDEMIDWTVNEPPTDVESAGWQ